VFSSPGPLTFVCSSTGRTPPLARGSAPVSAGDLHRVNMLGFARVEPRPYILRLPETSRTRCIGASAHVVVCRICPFRILNIAV